MSGEAWPTARKRSSSIFLRTFSDLMAFLMLLSPAITDFYVKKYPVLGGSLHAGVDGISSYNIDSWDGVSIIRSVLEKVLEGLSGYNT